VDKLMYIDGFITGNKTPDCPFSLRKPNIRYLDKFLFLPAVALAKAGCEVPALQCVEKTGPDGMTQNRVQIHKSSIKVFG
jgi:hypothetical protein